MTRETVERWRDWVQDVAEWPLAVVRGRHWTLRLVGSVAFFPWMFVVVAVCGFPVVLALVGIDLWQETKSGDSVRRRNL